MGALWEQCSGDNCEKRVLVEGFESGQRVTVVVTVAVVSDGEKAGKGSGYCGSVVGGVLLW